MEGITFESLTTVAGIAIATTIVDKLFWETIPSGNSTRFGPIVAVITGVALGVIAGLVLHQTAADLAQSVLNGVLGGFSAIGIYDTATSKAGLTA